MLCISGGGEGEGSDFKEKSQKPSSEVWGHAPPGKFGIFNSQESVSEAFSQYIVLRLFILCKAY